MQNCTDDTVLHVAFDFDAQLQCMALPRYCNVWHGSVWFYVPFDLMHNGNVWQSMAKYCKGIAK